MPYTLQPPTTASSALLTKIRGAAFGRSWLNRFRLDWASRRWSWRIPSTQTRVSYGSSSWLVQPHNASLTKRNRTNPLSMVRARLWRRLLEARKPGSSDGITLRRVPSGSRWPSRLLVFRRRKANKCCEIPPSTEVVRIVAQDPAYSSPELRGSAQTRDERPTT